MLQQTTHCLGQFINICGFMYRDAFDDKPTTPITKASLIGRSKIFFSMIDEYKLFYGSPFIEKLFWAASLITKVNPEVQTQTWSLLISQNRNPVKDIHSSS